MKYAKLDDIKALIAKPKDSVSISIFLPTHRVGLPHNLNADRVRMKNAIRDIKAVLSEKISKKEVKQYTQQLEKLRSDRNFWRFRDNGLALFVAANRMTYFDLPAEIDSRVHVDEHFVITPLLATMQDQYFYYVLELNRNEPRFFMASQDNINRALMDELPGSMKNALLIDEYQSQLQHSSGGANGGSSYHGHGGSKDNDRKDLERYLRMIDEILWKSVLHTSNRPLVILGDTKTAELYKQSSRYRYALDKSISGNFEHSNEQEIHSKTWNVIQVDRMKEEKIIKDILGRAKARDDQQLLVNNSSIKKAAQNGRVGTLIVGMLGKSYDSVVRTMERRYKITIPSNVRQLANIEAIAREVLASGGKVKSVIKPDTDNSEGYIKAITRPGGQASNY
ncbi:MAG: hypothetical protein M3Q36_02855 [bacterium]|nr:hypothetical protein [bacterium]